MDIYALICSPENIEKAYDSVLKSMREASRAQRGSCRAFAKKLDYYSSHKPDVLAQISTRLRPSGELAFRRFITKIPKKPSGPRIRPISLFSFEERVILRATLNILWPILEPVIVPSICYCTFRKDGLHPPRGTVAATLELANARKSAEYFVLKSDIAGFFDNIDRTMLVAQISKLVPDLAAIKLLECVLFCESEFDNSYFLDHEKILSTKGVPQGSALSPILACIFLSPFDGLMSSRGIKIIRYVDDLAILADSLETALTLEGELIEVLGQQFGGLQLSKHKTIISTPRESVEFLGHLVHGDGRISPSPSRKASVRKWIFSLIEQLPGRPDSIVVSELSSYLIGYFHSMSHCNFTDKQYSDFGVLIGDALERRGLDRKRLSRMLRKSSKKWPDAFLEGLP